MADIWAKIGGAVKKGAETTKDVLFLVPKALIYPIKKPFASWGEMKHDAKVSLKEAVGMDVPEKEKKYDSPIETTEASKNLGIETSYKDGKIKFFASRTLTGDIPYLTPEQLDKVKELNKNKENKYSSIAIFKEENKVVIEVDVKEISKEIKNASGNKGKSPEEIKKLVIEGIYGKVDRNLKGLAKITGGEFKVHTDRKLLYGIAEKLYRKYDEQSLKTPVPSHKEQQTSETTKKPIEPANNKKSSEQLSETAAPNKSSSTMKSSETIKGTDDEKYFGITNPNDFPFGKETISLTKIQLSQDIKKGLEGAFNFKDLSPGEKIESPLTSAIGNEKGERKSR